MSIRAYYIKKIETDQNPLFNLWHDDLIMDYLNILLSPQMTEDGTGVIELAQTEIQETLDEIKADKENLIKKYSQEEYEDAIQKLERMHNLAENESFIQFYCY